MSNKPKSDFFSFLKKTPETSNQNLEESFYYEQVAARVGAGGWKIDFLNKKSYFDKQMKAVLETPENYKPSLKHALHFFDMNYHDTVIKCFTDLSSNMPVFDEVIKMVTYTNKTFWAHVIGKPDLDKNNKIIGLKGIIVNVNQEKERELMLEKAIETVEANNSRLFIFANYVSHNIKSHVNNLDSINKGLHVARLERENRILRDSTTGKPGLTGTSPVIMRLREQIERVAPTDASVLIQGGHGTGKELVAQTIHFKSARRSRPMIEVNCAAIPEELIESELFGHERGAFTGATERRQGKFDQADGGTLFLDEIGDMSLKSQAKVLRILQEQKFERVGGSRTIQVDVRLLAATNKDLEEEIGKGTFRADLYYRLNVVPILVPPLRERIEDIPLLVQDFLEQFTRKGLGRKKFTAEAIHMLMSHSWPGNVRELRNLVERLVIMSPGEIITDKDAAVFLEPGSPPFSPVLSAGQYGHFAYREAKRHFEHDYLKCKLIENSGNISQTAEQIGLERSHLHKKVKSLNIELDKE